MQIPKRFKLLGHTIEVIENRKMLNERGWTGAAYYDECRLELLPTSDFKLVPESKAQQTFCHELSHFLSYYAGAAVNHKLGGDYLHQNEEFVDLLGSLLHQALTTMEY